MFKQTSIENTPLATYYHTLISGVSISELIEKNYLVPDEVYIYEIDEKAPEFGILRQTK